MTSSIPFLNGSLLHISIGQKPPGISVCHSVSCAQKGKGSAIVESNTVWQLPPPVKLQNILNYNVGTFTSSKKVFAEGVIFFLICGDKSSPKLPKIFSQGRSGFSSEPSTVETVRASLLQPNMSKTCDSGERLTSVFVSAGLT